MPNVYIDPRAGPQAEPRPQQETLNLYREKCGQVEFNTMSVEYQGKVRGIESFKQYEWRHKEKKYDDGWLAYIFGKSYQKIIHSSLDCVHLLGYSEYDETTPYTFTEGWTFRGGLFARVESKGRRVLALWL